MEDKEVKLDIIIPSFRVSFHLISQIVQLPKPEQLICAYLIIIDNPNKEISPKFKKLISDQGLIVEKNRINLGASLTRNKGINLSKSKWILFLDDDIIPDPSLLFEYYRFIINPKSSNYLGAIGATLFPKPINSFTNGIQKSQILTFFGISNWYETLKWGTTSNILIYKEKIGNERFSDKFPKNGGGEDIDFFLRVSKNNNQEFKSLSVAMVKHPWWDEGKRSYKRFFRWAYGDSLLPELHKEHQYYNFPNYIETFLLLIIPLFIKYGIVSTLVILFLLFIVNTFVEYCKIFIQQKQTNIFYAIESNIIRNANDLGRIVGNIRRGNFLFFFKRFDYFCDGKHIRTERLFAFYFFITILIILICYNL